MTVTREHMPTHPGKYVHRYFEIVSEGRRVIVRDTDLDARRGGELPRLPRLAPKSVAIGKPNPRSSENQRGRWVPIIADGAVAPTLTNYGKDWNDDPGRDGGALVVVPAVRPKEPK